MLRIRKAINNTDHFLSFDFYILLVKLFLCRYVHSVRDDLLFSCPLDSDFCLLALCPGILPLVVLWFCSSVALTRRPLHINRIPKQIALIVKTIDNLHKIV